MGGPSPGRGTFRSARLPSARTCFSTWFPRHRVVCHIVSGERMGRGGQRGGMRWWEKGGRGNARARHFHLHAFTGCLHLQHAEVDVEHATSYLVHYLQQPDPTFEEKFHVVHAHDTSEGTLTTYVTTGVAWQPCILEKRGCRVKKGGAVYVCP